MSDEAKTNTAQYGNNQAQRSVTHNGTISAVQRIINNRIASTENADVTMVSNDMMSGSGTESIAAYDQMETYQSFKDQMIQYCLDQGTFDSRDSQECTQFAQSLDTINSNLMFLNNNDESTINYKQMYNNMTSSNDVQSEASELKMVSGAWVTLQNKQAVNDMYMQNLNGKPERTQKLNDIVQDENNGESKSGVYTEDGTEAAEMLDSQNTSDESKHVQGESVSNYQNAKEKFINEKIAPYYESPGSKECLEVGEKLDSIKNFLDEKSGVDTGNSSHWNDYFNELSEQGGLSAMQKVEQDYNGLCVSGVMTGVVNSITSIPQNIADSAKNAGQWVMENASGSSVSDAISNGVEGVEKTIGDMANNYGNYVSNVIQMGQNGLSNMGATIGDIANNVGQGFNQMLNDANQGLDTSTDKPKAVETDGVSYNQNDSQDSGQSLLESKMMNSKYC